MGTPDSRTRDHLANDRTFLAWVRTGVALIGLGFVVARFAYVLRGTGSQTPPGAALGNVLGVLIVLVGGLIIALAVASYLRTRTQIEQGSYRSGAAVVLMLAGLSIAAAIGLAVYLLTSGTG